MMQQKCEELIVLLTKMIDDFDPHWQQNFIHARAVMQAADLNDGESVRVAVDAVLGMYGGMGALDDMFISTIKHQYGWSDLKAAEFDECRDRLWSLAYEVKYAAYDSFKEQASKESGEE